MTDVTIYRTAWCPYCQRAEALLKHKQQVLQATTLINIILIDVEQQPMKRAEMQQRSGRTSVPQIFIQDHAIGGYDDLAALERVNKLDALLQK